MFVIRVKDRYGSQIDCTWLYAYNTIRESCVHIRIYKVNFDVKWLKSIFIIFFGQLIIIGVVSLFFYYTKDEMTGLSVVSGGLVYCVPAFLAGLFMSRTSDQSAMLVVSKAYVGSLYKVGITIMLFIYVFKNMPINISLFLAAYVFTFVTQSVMSYILHKSN